HAPYLPYQYPAAPYLPPYPYPYAPRGTNGFAIGAFIASTAGSFAACGLGAVVGIILGIVALRQIKENPQGGKGFAIAGVAIGAVVVLLMVVFVPVAIYVDR
ncbi:MAG: DUF4190 domain-containing protein, partial [Rhodococcus sp.]|nr:DUF4190 domain-containing protein [Rhodococcus sp. (in: high G+C Gram-positive bacteria)]